MNQFKMQQNRMVLIRLTTPPKGSLILWLGIHHLHPFTFASLDSNLALVLNSLCLFNKCKESYKNS